MKNFYRGGKKKDDGNISSIMKKNDPASNLQLLLIVYFSKSIIYQESQILTNIGPEKSLLVSVRVFQQIQTIFYSRDHLEISLQSKPRRQRGRIRRNIPHIFFSIEKTPPENLYSNKA